MKEAKKRRPVFRTVDVYMVGTVRVTQINSNQRGLAIWWGRRQK